ncbi:hypothetical protein GCM10023187_39610 [Nibrella viscosa]|uniref:GPI transamidase subunit PIG-U n=1 Tax=Nibrella viscosa TaxID=1084524 RepID=A0ABP8KQ57_9BACT
MGYAPRSDTDFFYNKAVQAFQGRMVYRDFLSYHAPLFPYIISLPLFIWNNAKVIVLFMTAMEALIVWATYRNWVSREPYALVLMGLYYILPVSFIAIILSSEEDIWIWGVGLLTTLLAGRMTIQADRQRSTGDQSFWIGVIWGLAMITIKSMVVVLLLPVFFLVQHKFRYVAGLSVIGIPSLVILYLLMGDAFLMPIQHSGNHMAPNLVSVTRPLLSGVYNSVSLTMVNTIGLVFTVITASYLAFRTRHLGYKQAFPLVFVYTFSVFMLVEPSAPGFYLFTHMLPLMFVLKLGKNATFAYLFILLNALLAIQPVNWVLYAGMMDYDTWSSIFYSANTVADYVIQLISVIIMVDIVRRCLRLPKITESAPVAHSHPSSSLR